MAGFTLWPTRNPDVFEVTAVPNHTGARLLLAYTDAGWVAATRDGYGTSIGAGSLARVAFAALAAAEASMDAATAMPAA